MKTKSTVLSQSESRSSGWIEVATRPGVVQRSVSISMLVATILGGINQGNVLFEGGFSPA
ncbi:MAG: hypothetical protein AB8G18_07335 [Gammaproteobacteria bacterium]